MADSKVVNLFGYASGLGAADPGAAQGPLTMNKSPHVLNLIKNGLNLQWKEIIEPNSELSHTTRLQQIADQCERLAERVSQEVKNNQFFLVVGGDHSGAIGTWSGASHGIKEKGDLGLIWIDAHMDSHTPHTTLSGNIHGMPVASLLGYGLPSLSQILNSQPKIKPENLCLIGVRSFERGEAALLKELNVKIFFIDEVKQRGLSAVMTEALDIVTQKTIAFGVSIDVDGLCPEDAPGTGCPVANGIEAHELYSALQVLFKNPKLIGLEVAEFDPHHDKEQKTEKIIAELIARFASGNIPKANHF